MRLYVFTHMQTTGLHAGIQALHATVDMARKYEQKAKSDPKSAMKKAVLNEWADNHKTVWLKNGGNHGGLNDLYRKLTHYSACLNLPIGKFEEPSLNWCTTAVCIVVPSFIYDIQEPETLDSDEAKLAALLRQYPRFAV